MVGAQLMTDDIDNHQAIQQHKCITRGFHPCPRRGQMTSGDNCPFCAKLKVAEPVKKTRWVGRQRV